MGELREIIPTVAPLTSVVFTFLCWLCDNTRKAFPSALYMAVAGFLNHWGQVMHICVGNLTIIVSDNGLSPGRRQVIVWTNAGILLIGPLGTNFSEILIEIHTFSFKKMHLKMSSAKWRPFCLGLNVLNAILFAIWTVYGTNRAVFILTSITIYGTGSILYAITGTVVGERFEMSHFQA